MMFYHIYICKYIYIYIYIHIGEGEGLPLDHRNGLEDATNLLYHKADPAGFRSFNFRRSIN